MAGITQNAQKRPYFYCHPSKNNLICIYIFKKNDSNNNIEDSNDNNNDNITENPK